MHTASQYAREWRGAFGASTAQQTVSPDMTWHLTDCKQSYDQNTCTTRIGNQLNRLAAVATVSTVVTVATVFTVATVPTAQEDTEHGTRLSVLQETELSVLFLNWIQPWMFEQLACGLIMLPKENVNLGTWQAGSAMCVCVCNRMHVRVWSVNDHNTALSQI
jgi:hypothetical protein